MEKVPSVSKVLSIFGSQKLMEWANKLGLNSIPLDEYLDEKADIGNLLHSMICNYFEGNKPILDLYGQAYIEEAKSMMVRFEDFLSEFSIEPLLLEEKLYCDCFCGIIDFYGYLNGKPCIIDFKSGFPQLKHKIQISAYYYLCQYNNIPVEKLYILSLTQKAKSFILVRVYEPEKYQKVFFNMLEIYNMLSEEIGEFKEYV